MYARSHTLIIVSIGISFRSFSFAGFSVTSWARHLCPLFIFFLNSISDPLCSSLKTSGSGSLSIEEVGSIINFSSFFSWSLALLFLLGLLSFLTSSSSLHLQLVLGCPLGLSPLSFLDRAESVVCYSILCSELQEIFRSKLSTSSSISQRYWNSMTRKYIFEVGHNCPWT